MLKNLIGMALSGMSLLLPGKSSATPPSKISDTSKHNNVEMGYGFVNLLFGNSPTIKSGEESNLIRLGNTLLDLNRIAAATFQPESPAQAAQLRLILNGGGEITLEKETALQLWAHLQIISKELATGQLVTMV